VAEAAELRGKGDLAACAASLRRILALWRGEALACLPGPFAEAQRMRLTEQYWSAKRQLFEVELGAGRHGAVVGELREAVDLQPYRESLVELLMLALYRCGCQAESIDAYNRSRERLADELGVHPCGEVTELFEQIVRADPALELPAAAGQPMRSLVPRQLPGDPLDFTAREGEVAKLTNWLTGERTLVGVVGTAGMGKSTLAVHVGHRLAGRFPDGQLFCGLRGVEETPRSSADALGFLLRSLGVDGAQLPVGVEERAARWRSLLARNCALIVLDDAVDAEQVRPLLPGTSGCAVIVTSRRRLAELPGLSLVQLGPMGMDDSLRLLTEIVGRDRIDAEPEAARHLVKLCAGLPLALRIAGARVASGVPGAIRVLVRRLTDSRERLSALGYGTLTVRAAFEASYAQLAERESRAFRLLALPAILEISIGAAAALLDVRNEDAEDLLRALCEIGLLDASEAETYRFHDLVAQFARKKLDEQRADGERGAALPRLLGYVIGSLLAVDRIAAPELPLTKRWHAPSPVSPTVTNRSQAIEFGHRVYRDGLSLAEQAAPLWPNAAADLLDSLEPWLDSGGHWEEWALHGGLSFRTRQRRCVGTSGGAAGHRHSPWPPRPSAAGGAVRPTRAGAGARDRVPAQRSPRAPRARQRRVARRRSAGRARSLPAQPPPGQRVRVRSGGRAGPFDNRQRPTRRRRVPRGARGAGPST
jgi:hypothetical protein